MTIQRPRARYSETDRRIISIIPDIILHNLSHLHDNNISNSRSIVTESNASELIDLINLTIESREFYEKAYFCREISKSTENNIDELKELFLSGLKKTGRSRAMSGMRWAEFVERFLVRSGIRSQRAMPIEHFWEMEKRLFRELRVHPAVTSYILSLMRQHEAEIQASRSLDANKRAIDVQSPLQHVADVIKVSDRNPDVAVSKRALSATMIIIIDAGVIFTSRDWSVAGTLSCIAGAIGSLAEERWQK